MDRKLHSNFDRDFVGESSRQVEFEGFIGQSSAFGSLKSLITLVAAQSVPVIIRGETGTGKELCARAIHSLSSRAEGPFVPANCGEIPAELMANEFFGHEPGAFTGAVSPSKGLIGRAQGGTLVLDEIDSFPFSVQSMLLRFLQDKIYQRLGGQQSQMADVRILAVTNADLNERMEKGLFRRDLYYRLKVVEIVMPPLRERQIDIGLLAHHFVGKYAEKFHKPVLGLTADCIAKLTRHDWPGNVRELEAAIISAVLVTRSTWLVPEDVSITPPASQEHSLVSFKAAKENFEFEYLRHQLNAAGGNISLAARRTDMSRGAMWRLLHKHGLISVSRQANGQR